MKSVVSVIGVVSLVVAGCTQAPASSAPAPVQGTAATVGGSAGPSTPAAAAATANAQPAMTPEQIAARNDSLVKDRTEHVNEVLARIAGKEQQPAESVYKNIKMLK